MKRTLLFAPFVFLASLAFAANNSVNEACKRLCETESECVRKCVGHAELFELRCEFISAAADWSPTIETRMKVLRSGANLEVLEICQKTGWSLENKLTCLRSYPTPEVLKACKKLSPRQEEQMRCLRMGKSEAEVNACIALVPGSDLALACLQKQVTAQETRECRRMGLDSKARMDCLEQAVREHEAESVAFEREVRRRVAEEKKREEQNRMPASKKIRETR
jgi:hypothetical protein